MASSAHRATRAAKKRFLAALIMAGLLLPLAPCSLEAAVSEPRYLEFDGPDPWTFRGEGRYTARRDRRGLYLIRHPWEPAATGDFGQIETRVTLPAAWQPPIVLHFYAADDYIADDRRGNPGDFVGIEAYHGHRFKQALINGAVVWERDVADWGTASFAVDLTPHVRPGESFTLALRVFDRAGTDRTLPGDYLLIGATETGVKKPEDPRRFMTHVWWGDVALTGGSSASEAGASTPERSEVGPPLAPRPRPSEALVAPRHGERVTAPGAAALEPLRSPWREPILLPLETPAPLPAAGFPVTCGVPLPYGAARSIQRVGLRDAAGRPVPVQRRVLNTWPDGSLRWVLLDLAATTDGGPYRLDLESAPLAADLPPPAPPQPIATRLRREPGRRGGSRVTITTGALTVALGADPDRLIDRVTLPGERAPAAESVAGRLVLEREGRRVSFHPRWDEMEIVERGPLRVTVELRGKLAGDGPTPGRFRFRVHAYAGQPFLRAFVRLYNDTAETLAVRDWSLLLSRPSRPADPVEVAWGDADGTPGQTRLGDDEADGPLPVVLTQSAADRFTVREGVRSAGEGRRSGGWLGMADARGDVIVAVRHAWQQFPNALRARRGGLEIGLFAPSEEEPVFAPTPGEAKRHEVWLAFRKERAERPGGLREHGPALAALFQAPPRLFSPEWFCASGALGAAHPHTDPRFAALGEFMRKTYGDAAPERFNISFGIRHFGDRRYGDPANDYWSNNYYDAMHGFFSEYLMGGGRAWFDRGEETARHVMDIDQVHHSVDQPELVGAIHAYNGANHTSAPPWNAMLRQGAGFAIYHRLTGDPDARDALRELADYIVRARRGLGSTSSRDHAGVLVTLVWAYDEFRDPQYLQAARRLVEDLLSGRTIDRRRGAYVEIHGNYNYRGNVPWMDVQLAEPLYHYYRHSGDLDAAQLVVGIAESLIAENMTPDVPGDFYGYSHNPHFAKTSNYHVLIAPSIAYAYDLTGDEEFLRCARAAYEQTLREKSVNAVVNCYWNTPALLWFLR